MASEDEIYAYYLYKLDAWFSQELLNHQDIAKFLGINPRTVVKNFSLEGKYISKATFARLLVNQGYRNIYNRANAPVESDEFFNTK